MLPGSSSELKKIHQIFLFLIIENKFYNHKIYFSQIWRDQYKNHF